MDTERIIQYGFDDEFREAVEYDVTPPGFTGLGYPQRREIDIPDRLGRFVREAAQNIQIVGAIDMVAYLREFVFDPWEDFTQEEMWCMLLDTKNIVRYDAMLYRGTLNQINIRVAEIFREAVKHNAAALIISHNHPSGIAEASPEDVAATKRLIQAGDILDIPLLDHLIVGKDQWSSLRQDINDLWEPES